MNSSLLFSFYLCGVDVVKVEVDWHTSVVVDVDNELLVDVAVVGDLEVVTAGALIGVDGLHEHGDSQTVAVIGWCAHNIDIAKTG